MELYTITSDNIVCTGSCTAKIHGKTVFVPGALPGEQIEIRIIKEKKDYAEGSIERILTPSLHRREPPCPQYGRCGGCNLQYADDAFQVMLRRDMLAGAFTRAGVSVASDSIICKTGNAWGYRSRFQLHDGGLMPRFSVSGASAPDTSCSPVPPDSCPVASPEVQAYFLRTPVQRRPRGRVCLFADSRLQNAADKAVIGAEAVQEHTQPRCAHKKIPAKTIRRFSGTPDAPQYRCVICLTANAAQEPVCKDIAFDVRGFFQSNPALLEQTICEALRFARGRHLLDMYCGCAVFSAFLAGSFEHTTLVEHNRDALVYAEENMRGAAHSSFGVSGARWVQEHAASCEKSAGSIDTVFIDPPRSGMEAEVVQWLCHARGVERIISLSCDPATHARDCAKLVQAGYALTMLELLDFYPQTSHIESLAVLERA